MGDKTGIEWTDSTWNAMSGCDKVSPGCDNCYALTQAARLKRMGQANYQRDGDPRTSGPGFGFTEHPHMLDRPLRWKRPRKIFVNSMSDMFHPEATPGFIAKMFAVMACAQQHQFQILTKRPQRMLALLTDDAWLNLRAQETSALARAVKIPVEDNRPFEWPLRNVQLGVTIESAAYAWRADRLRATPAAVRFISAEPLITGIPALDLTGIDWLIVGSESGQGHRPMDLDWIRELRDIAATAGTAFFVKQIGDGTPKAVKDIEAFPVDLRIRQTVDA
jgi:protein gp37